MKALYILFFVSTSTFAFNDDPLEVFNASKNLMYNNSQVELHISDTDYNGMWKVCDSESRKRGFGGFPKKVYACTFWNEDHQRKCSIYIAKNTNMHQLGHELRHCFYGQFHD